MGDLESELVSIRERMVVGMEMVRQLAALALEAPPELAKQLENIVSLSHGCVESNIRDLTRLLEHVSRNTLAA